MGYDMPSFILAECPITAGYVSGAKRKLQKRKQADGRSYINLLGCNRD